MPIKTETTCDICGAEARSYPSFFFIDRQEKWGRAGGNMTRLRLGAPEIRTDVFAERYGGSITADHRGVCLCTEHFASLVVACRDWLSAAAEQGDV